MQRLNINIVTYVLDDQEMVLQLIEREFYNEGISHYQLFSNETEFLDAITENVHIAVIDYMLSSIDMTGLDVCKKLLEKNPRCLVIIMSGQSDMDVVIDFMNSGAWKYVRKYEKNYLHKVTDFIKQGVKEISADLDFYKSLLEKYKEKIDVPTGNNGNGN